MKISTKLLTILLLTIILIKCDSAVDNIPPIVIKRHFKKAMWVVRFSLTTKEKCDKVIRFALNNNFGVIVAQFRGRGDAFYKSEHEPKYRYVQKNFDPLAYLSKQCDKYSLELHAWINMMYAANVNIRKPQKTHVLRLHPEWVTIDSKGRSISDYKRKELRNNLLEGTFLDAGVPDVKGWLASVTTDIAKRYKVKGIHFDFIRYPWSGFNGYYKKYLKDFGYNPEARMRFMEKYGMDPVNTPYKRYATTKQLWRQFRRDRITEIVKTCNKAAKKANPNLIISAAVIANAPVVRNVYFQDWKFWIKQGILDTVFPMSYSQYMGEFKKFIRIANPIKHKLPVFMGVHIKKKTNPALSAKQMRMIYDNGFHGICVFSYDRGRPQMQMIKTLFREKNVMQFE